MLVRLLLLAGAAALSACGTATSPVEAPASEAPPSSAAPAPGGTALFDFNGADAPEWTVVNDGVMGGDSKGFVSVEDGALAFTGETVTAGGGFTSIRTQTRLDLATADGVEMRVRGGGRTFELEVDDGTQRGRRSVSRRASFPTTEAWQTVRVPFATLKASVFGEPVEAPPLDRAAVRALGLYIADGQDGPFRLEVDWMRTYAGQ